MPDLFQSLQKKDLGHLKIIAELWGFEFSAPDFKIGLQRLIPKLLEPELIEDTVQALPVNAREALDELIRNEGRMPWDIFQRRFGKVRMIGAARRERDQPYRAAKASPAEDLWYRGLVAQGFSLDDEEAREFAYIPTDLLALLPQPTAGRSIGMGRPATAAEKAFVVPATDRILDDACTLLAALRMDHRLQERATALGAANHYLMVDSPLQAYPLRLEDLRFLLASAGIISERAVLQSDMARSFLEASRSGALAALVRAWVTSRRYNDLRSIPGLIAEGEWINDPVRTRRAVLDFLSTIPGADRRRADPSERPYWSLSAFVSAVQQAEPDFQRTAGEYDSWYIKDAVTGAYLRGIKYWDQVEGELIRFMICGPLHWLGIIDLGFPAPPAGEKQLVGPATAFRFSEWAADLLNFSAPAGFDLENEKIKIGSDGRIFIPRLTRRSVRYQAARFTEWQRMKQDRYIYKITPASLDAAREIQIKVPQIIGFLRKNVEIIPPALITALERWETEGSPARIDRLLVLRAKTPEVIQAIRESKLARYLGEPLGPAAVIIHSGALEKVVDGLAEMGMLIEVSIVQG